VHDHPFARQLGQTKTKEQLARLFWWPQWSKDVDAYVREHLRRLLERQANKLEANWAFEAATYPWLSRGSVGLDFITHLPKTRSGHTFVFVCIDRLSKMVHSVPKFNSDDAECAAQTVIDTFVKLHGMP
jgi:hypothetical protein